MHDAAYHPGVRTVGTVLTATASIVLAGTAASAPAAETIPGKIVPAVGVGKLRLGMTEAATRRVLRPLGAPTRYRRLFGLRLPTDYAEYQYPSFVNGYGAISYIVGYRRRGGIWRLAMIHIGTARNATAAGARVSTPVETLRRRHPAARCKEPNNVDGRYLCYLGRNHRAARTVFVVLNTAEVRGGTYSYPLEVARIVIREPGYPLIRMSRHEGRVG